MRGRRFCSLRLAVAVAILIFGLPSLRAVAGDDEKWVQETLNAVGYDVGRADGVLGKRSLSALRRFQEERGLSPTAELDEPTIRALRFARRCETRAYREEKDLPLFGAVFCDDMEHFERLLEGGADPLETTKGGQTLLFMAAANGRDAFIEPIVAAGVDIDHVAENDYTALMFAVARGREETTKLLLALGADKRLPRGGRVTAASLAAREERSALLDLVRLDFDPAFRACIDAIAARKISDPRIELVWLAETGELKMITSIPPVGYTASGMPRHTLGILDSLLGYDAPEESLLGACEAECGGYCLPG